MSVMRTRGAGTTLVYVAGTSLLLALASYALSVHLRGLRGDYGVAQGGDRQGLAVRRDRILFFPRIESFLAPYLAHWDGPRLGFPDQLPTVDIDWAGVLEVATPRSTIFAADGSGVWRVAIGDLVLDSSPGHRQSAASLGAGLHAIHISFRSSGATTSFKLYEVSDGKADPMAADLFPDASSALASHRCAALAALSLSIAAALAAWIAWKIRLDDAGRTASFRVAAAALLAVCFLLRVQGRTAAPLLHETMDEYYVAWSGWSLLHGHAPTAWDLLARFYPHSTPVSWFGRDFDLVTPFVHEPPLFPILAVATGSAVSAFTGRPNFPNATLFSAPPIEAIRVFPIVLSTIALWLLIVLARRLFGTEAALAAGLLYATTPALVIVQRLVKDEGLTAVAMLASLALLLRRPGPNGSAPGPSCLRVLGPWQMTALGAICAASPLIKIPALFLPLSLALIVLVDSLAQRPNASVREVLASGQTRVLMLTIAGGAVIGILALLGYAAALDWSLFWKIAAIDAAREADFANAWRILSLRVIAEERAFGPGWTDFLWIAALPVLALRAPRLAWVLFAHMLTMAAAVDRSFVYGWYLIPAYPLLALGAGASLFPERKSPEESQRWHDDWAWFALGLFWLLYLGSSLSLLTGGQVDTSSARGFFAVSGGIFVLALARGQRTDSGRRLAGWLILCAAAVLNACIVMRAPLYY